MAEEAKGNPWLVAFAVSLATFMEVLDTTITNVSLSHIGGSLAASQEESTWVMTSYLVSNAIILPISGWIAGVIGRKRYFMLCIAGFTIASFFCGAATSLWMIIVFRLLQGVAGGGLQPTQQAIMLDTFTPEKRAQAFAITAVTMIVAPVIGPTLGGFITDNFSWRWIFFINIPVGLFALFLVNRVYHERFEKPAKGSYSVDYIGFSLIALGIGAIQIVLDKGQQDDWFGSNFILSLSVMSVVMITSACWWLLRQKNPLVELRLFKISSFRMACILVFFMGFVLYGSSLLMPLLVQSYFGYNATLSGLILSPGALAIIVLMPLSTRMVKFFQPKYLIALGFFLCGLGIWYTKHFSPDTNMLTFVSMRILTVMGLPFLFIPISMLAFGEVPKQLNNKASALYSLCRNLGGSFGIALIASYLARHQQIWQTYLSATLSPYSIATQQALASKTAALTAAGTVPAAAAAQAQGQLYSELLQQSGFMAYVDSFGMMAAVMFLMSFLTLLTRSSKKPPAADAGAAMESAH
jgi:DHA2 family multidrug resistance protein